MDIFIQISSHNLIAIWCGWFILQAKRNATFPNQWKFLIGASSSLVQKWRKSITRLTSNHFNFKHFIEFNVRAHPIGVVFLERSHSLIEDFWNRFFRKYLFKIFPRNVYWLFGGKICMQIFLNFHLDLPYLN